jgi:hypothetical protein
VRSQSHPLELIASVETEKEIESRLISILREKSAGLELTTGVPPSLSEDKLKIYLKEVLKQSGRQTYLVSTKDSFNEIILSMRKLV